MKTVTFMYSEEDPAALAIYQDLTSQIRVFSFRQSQIANIKNQNHAENAGIYFLLSEDNDLKEIYIGQSINGIGRIETHVATKMFWQRCFLFVTDNASFSKTAIDFLEYYFIQLFKDSDYIIQNKELRNKKPNLNDFEEPALLQSARHIEFLLACSGIYKKQQESYEINQIFHARGKNKAQIAIKDGQFILLKGSHIAKPKERLKSRKNTNTYDQFMSQFNQVVETNKASMIDDSTAVTNVDISFASPSGAGKLVYGSQVNGWTFWQGLSDIREQLNKE